MVAQTGAGALEQEASAEAPLDWRTRGQPATPCPCLPSLQGAAAPDLEPTFPAHSPSAPPSLSILPGAHRNPPRLDPFPLSDPPLSVLERLRMFSRANLVCHSPAKMLQPSPVHLRTRTPRPLPLPWPLPTPQPPSASLSPSHGLSTAPSQKLLVPAMIHYLSAPHCGCTQEASKDGGGCHQEHRQ